MTEAIEIVRATSPAHLQQIRELFEEYAATLDSGHLCLQDFAHELAGLPGDYAAPDGRLILALSAQEKPAGCVALRRIGESVGELKRLYVRPQFRGTGAGKALARAAINAATEIGYTSLRLDTLPSMEKAVALYRALGFREIASYQRSPIAGAIFMELDLTRAEK